MSSLGCDALGGIAAGRCLGVAGGCDSRARRALAASPRATGGASTVRVAEGLTPSFIEPDRRHKPNLFFGVVIDGAAVLKK